MSGPSCMAHLLPPTWKKHIQMWLEDDIPSFDIGGYVVGESIKKALLFGKSDGILAGVPFFEEIFKKLDCTVEWKLTEGSKIDLKDTDTNKVIVAEITGKCRNILLGERTALNILTRASGIATQAFETLEIARQFGWNGHLSGTRKTTPGFRLIEKYALMVAGVSTHRHDLSQMVMLKDNHIWAAGSITKAVSCAKKVAGFHIKIEVECQNQKEAEEAATAGADIVMLDNMRPDVLRSVAQSLKERFSHVLIEASGGITAVNIVEYTSPHVDIISQGSLTQGYPCLDFSLKIQKSNSL
ncbi:unnamed protein product [Albugo candida]|uniref:Nicotinate-nucleotide pyrophosphorylase [carboxylating] n=1 Tax=Albugo candida TaxID=65357 RepID=A0A024GT00_9STRA|nr:unnamed protein product [Albugo candida]|eukprot:CCI49909.1 unnamed protein product [Albugo candida]